LPKLKVWDSNRRDLHDSELKSAGRQGKDSIAIAKRLHDDLAKVDALADKVIAAALGKQKRTKKAGALHMHEIIANLHKKGVDVLKAGPQDLTPAQRKRHHDGVDAITPLLKRSADNATELGKCLSEIHKAFEAISTIHKK
jgi:hypothetical protein